MLSRFTKISEQRYSNNDYFTNHTCAPSALRTIIEASKKPPFFVTIDFSNFLVCNFY